MAKIYEKASDLHVVATYVYKKSGDAYAYSDSAQTAKIDCNVLADMFRKGIIVVDGGVEYVPISCGVSSGVATITYVKTDTTTATTAVLATLVSEEYNVG